MSRLKIALVSYEYPPDIGQGGIATYIGQLSAAMTELGHYVEIFSGSLIRECSEIYNGVLTHRIKCNNPDEFSINVVKKFTERHTIIDFNLFECAEINANGAYIKEQFPDLPLIVKLHAPTYLLIKLLNYYTSPFLKLRFLLGNLKRGTWRPWGKPDLSRDKDYLFTSKADYILSPSLSLRNIIAKDWLIAKDQIRVIPNPYKPSEELLSIPVRRSKIREEINVLFVGKLNIQKGVLLLAEVIPDILKDYKNVRFTLIGADGPSPVKDISMKVYLKEKLKYFENIEFVNAIELEEVSSYLADADICVIPSLWENFPYVCLEAMSAGKPVIGSKKGGMSEMLADGAGILVEPTNSKQLREEIELLIKNSDKRVILGESARKRVIDKYNLSRVGKQMEELYLKAVKLTHYENKNMC